MELLLEGIAGLATTDYHRRDSDLLVLAGRVGNTLLLENRQLREQNVKIHEHYQAKLEELHVKLRAEQSQRGDLQLDVSELTQALSDSKERLQTTRRLQYQQQEETWQKVDAMREQVMHFTEKEQVLEERLQTVSQENMELRERLATINNTLHQTTEKHNQQLAEACHEVEMAHGRSQQLQHQMEELLEETSLLQAGTHTDTSLLSELKQAGAGHPGYWSSLDTTPLTHSMEQTTEEGLSAGQGDLVRERDVQLGRQSKEVTRDPSGLAGRRDGCLNDQQLDAIQRGEISLGLQALPDDIHPLAGHRACFLARGVRRQLRVRHQDLGAHLLPGRDGGGHVRSIDQLLLQPVRPRPRRQRTAGSSCSRRKPGPSTRGPQVNRKTQVPLLPRTSRGVLGTDSRRSEMLCDAADKNVNLYF